MSQFTRSFDVAALAAWDDANPGNAVRELFSRWCLPGSANSGRQRLRIGLRAGYLNFYVKGQSVAKLSITSGGQPRIEVHRAYVDGKRRDRGAERVPNAQNYRTYGGTELASQDVASAVSLWVETAETYASAEKRFVNDLVSANAGVIDLEMGLPASETPGSERVAPRMDLVVVQADGAGSSSIAFWEAKCANNAELRARDHVPRVFGQVQKYVDWVSAQDRIREVTEAYRVSAQILLALHTHFRGEDYASHCGDLWRLLATDEATSIVSKPGIVIGNYWPDGSPDEVASGRMRQAAASFKRNGHRAALEQKGIKVHEVGPDDQTAVLPILSAQTVTG